MAGRQEMIRRNEMTTRTDDQRYLTN